MVEIAQLIAAIATLIVACGGFLLALSKIEEVHVATNSKMDQLLAEVRESSYRQGRKDEKEMEIKGGGDFSG